MKPPDYNNYFGGKREILQALFKSTFCVMVLAYIFYRSWWAVLFLLPVGAGIFVKEIKRRIKGYREQLALEFKECILSVAASLKAGYSVENALMESMGDMKRMYGPDSLIYKELEIISRGLIINIAPEELFADLGRRSANEDICRFAEIFRIARSNGGNLPEIIGGTALMISNKTEVRAEIRATLSGRMLEQKVMRIMPLGILLYIEFSTPGYFASLYHNPEGIGIMTLCLGIYTVGYLWGERVMDNIFS